MKGFIVIGSNFGNREINIRKAVAFLKSFCKILRHSDIYESQDNLGSGNNYLNIVLEIESAFTEQALNEKFKHFEAFSGRDTLRRKRGEVPLDIDIVMCDGQIRRQHDYDSKYFQIGFNRMMNSESVKLI